MSALNRAFAAFALALAFAFGNTVWAAEEWAVVEAASGSGARWMAQVKNSQGHALRVWRKIERTKFKALAQLELAGGTKFGKEIPTHAIDDAQPSLLENWGERTASTDANKLTWQLWAATTAELGQNDAPQAWMRGNRITFFVKDGAGKEQAVSFTLAGSQAALTRVITGTYQ